MGDPITYEHMTPDLVGNQRKVLVTDTRKEQIICKARESTSTHETRCDSVEMVKSSRT
jgi:isopropylmalate/homocitrate/citramalate synthase